MKTIIWICGFYPDDARDVLQKIYKLFGEKEYFADIVPTIMPLDELSATHPNIENQPYILVFNSLSPGKMLYKKDIMETLALLDTPTATILMQVPAFNQVTVLKKTEETEQQVLDFAEER